jgi:hypothetical protein
LEIAETFGGGAVFNCLMTPAFIQRTVRFSDGAHTLMRLAARVPCWEKFRSTLEQR